MDNLDSKNSNTINPMDIIPENSVCDDSKDNLDDENFPESKDFLKFSIKLELVNNVTMSEVLKREYKKNDDVMIIKATCKSESYENSLTWELIKTFPKLKELIGEIKKMARKARKQHQDSMPIENNLDILASLKLAELKSKGDTIVSLLNEILQYENFRTSPVLLEFLEISRLSFENDGEKPKEGYILKQADPRRCRRIVSCVCFCFCCCWRNYNKRWFVLKDDMICYLDSLNTTIGKDIYWFDQEIKVERNFNNTTNTIAIINASRKLILKFDDEFERELWFDNISQRVQLYKSNVQNKLLSFANAKEQCNAKWFVDANGYWNDLYIKLMGAKQTIFIAGWWISPELFLERPVRIDDYKVQEEGKSRKSVPFKCSRLMDILKHKAQNNIKIFILVFREVPLALTINSHHTKSQLNFLHPNIKVTRHPISNFEWLWSDHEKIVIIDQKYGYVGGLDLCWGRYDTSEHLIHEDQNEEGLYMWPGIDYSNSRIRDFENVDLYQKESISRGNEPRMPWHDIHLFIEGPAVSDLARHFVERWNFARTVDRNRDHTITNVKQTVVKRLHADSRLSKGSSDSQLHTPLMEEAVTEGNIIEDTKKTYKKELEVIPEISPTKIKSHMLFTRRTEQELSLRELRIEKISLAPERRTSSITESRLSREINPPSRNFFDKIKGAFRGMISSNERWYNKIFSGNRDRNSYSTEENLLSMNINANSTFRKVKGKRMTCQVVRSASDWSAGLDKMEEKSILNAYYDLIDNSQHYIYIENQFFISKTFTDEEWEAYGKETSNIIENEIVLHIRRRIEKAYNERQKFRVLVFIPLLPGFAGDVSDTPTLQIILKYTYKTICRNKGLSLFEKLYDLMQDNFEDYIYFFSLRTHGLILDIPKTELVYIHSKLLIVDDQVCLVGSANLNDRSMLGNRDSEIAVIVREEETIDSLMNGKPYQASDFVRSLRIRLIKEHMGFLQEDTNETQTLLIDPLNDLLFENMKTFAKGNTQAYREIFNCYPDCNFTTFDEIPKDTCNSVNEIDALRRRYAEKKNSIKGTIVEFPIDFLKNEKLKTSYFCKEALLPVKNFL